MKLTLREWQSRSKDVNTLIVQASTTDGADRWQPFPIGMQYNYYHNYRKGDSIQIGNHENTVLCCISAVTDMHARPNGINRQSICNNLQQNNIHNRFLQHYEYYSVLPSYKFMISPRGAGIDTHRHYETLLAGCIPIVEHDDQIKEKYMGCPILYTTDYSEINEKYLLDKYNEMIDMEYDFSRLFISFYDDENQSAIKECGNYWIHRFTGNNWYL